MNETGSVSDVAVPFSSQPSRLENLLHVRIVIENGIDPAKTRNKAIVFVPSKDIEGLVFQASLKDLVTQQTSK